MSFNFNSSLLLQPDQTQILDVLTSKRQRKRWVEVKRRNGRIRWMIGGLMIIVLIGLLCGLLFSGILNNNSLNQVQESQDLIVEAVQNNPEKLIIDSSAGDWISTYEPSSVTHLILQNLQLTSFDTTPFTSLESLTIQQNVKLQNLVINNTQLTEFIYSSQELKTLKLINNTKLIIFLNSTLPSLTHLYVAKTPLREFKDNILDSISYVSFTDSKIESLQLFNTSIKDLVIQNCGPISTYPRSFSDYPHLETVLLSNSTFQYDASFNNLPYLNSVTIQNCTFDSFLSFQNCPKLQQLNIQSPSIDQLTIQNASSLYFFNPKIQRIYKIQFSNINIHEFIIQTQQLKSLTITGDNPRRIQENIPGLQYLSIRQSNISDSEFSRIVAPNVTKVHIINCSNLQKPNPQFPELLTLQFDFQSEINLSLIDAPKLSVIELYFSQFETFDTSPFSSLSIVQTLKSSIQNLIIQDPVHTVILSEPHNLTNLILNSSVLENIIIEVADNVTIMDTNFTSLRDFKIRSSSNIQVINNTFPENLREFYLSFINESVVLENNTFLFDIDNHNLNFIMEDNDLVELKQKLTGVWKADLQGNLFSYFDNIMEWAGEVRVLDVSRNWFENISEIEAQNLTELYLQSSLKLIQFSDNNFENLTKLSFEFSNNLEVFRNNTLPMLRELSLRNCTSLREQKILDEFQSLRGRGTELEELVISEGTEEFEEQIKEIFPGVNIVRRD